MSWIEVVDGLGRVVARRTAVGVPCTIGSAADNTLVVEDSEVAPYHARIDREADGSLTVTVLGGSSGLHRPGAPERAMALALSPSAAVAMGGSIIRLVDEASRDVPVSAPTVEPPPSGWRAFVARRPVQWASVAVLTVMGAAIGYFTLPGSERAVNALVVAAVLMVSECAWVGMWALTGRIRHGTARFGKHFVVATAITVLGWMLGEMESWQKFLVPGATARRRLPDGADCTDLGLRPAGAPAGDEPSELAQAPAHCRDVWRRGLPAGARGAGVPRPVEQ